MKAPLQLYDYTSWDSFAAAGDIADRRHRFDPGFTTWSGSIGSLITGWTGSGQAIRNPTNLHRRLWYENQGYYNTVYVLVRFRTPTGTEGDIVRLRAEQTLGVFANVFRFYNDGAALKVDCAGSTYTSSSDPLTVNTWHTVEIAVHLDDADGSFRVRVDSVDVEGLHQTGIDTRDFSEGGFGNPYTNLRNIAITHTDGDFDDLIIKTGYDGFRDTDFMAKVDGSPRLLSIFPTDTVQSNGWTAVSAASLHQAVDEEILNTTNYITSSGNNHNVRFGLAAAPATMGAIYGMKHFAWAWTDNAPNPGRLRYVIGHECSDGTRLPIKFISNDEGTLSNAWLLYEVIWWQNIRKERPFEPADFDELLCGFVREEDGTDEFRIAQCGFEVLYDLVPSSVEFDISDMIKTTTHRRASLFSITRVDGEVFRFTNAAEALVGPDGYTYTPAGGGDISAERREAGQRERNKDFLGIITSDAITDEDLRQGRYRNALVEERVVDWKYPWFVELDYSRYWVGETRWTGVWWEVQLSGVGRYFAIRTGDVVSRDCAKDFGGKGCFFALEARTLRGVTVASVSVDRRQITAVLADDSEFNSVDAYYERGFIQWHTGLNWGLVSTIKKHTAETGNTHSLTFDLKTPSSISVGDIFDISAGCRHTPADCKLRENFDNYGGKLHVPGTDKALETPDL